MAKKRRRRRNPWSRPVTIAAAGVAAIAAGYGAYRIFEYRRARGALEPSKEGTVLPGCEIGPSYPGFVQAEDGTCQPSGTTPAGIYVDAACEDFIFVSGDDGDQVALLEKMIAASAIASNEGLHGIVQGQSADPIVVASAFLHATWPDCEWPPAADGPVRLVQMFEALCYMIGRAIVEDHGRVLGTKSPEIVDHVVTARLDEIGLPPFKPAIVPEFDIDLEGLGKTGQPGGNQFPEPGPKQGGIGLPGGQGDMPGHHGKPPTKPPVAGGGGISGGQLPACWVDPYTVVRTTTSSRKWYESYAPYETKLFEFKGKWDQCNDYTVTVGLCLRVVGTDHPYGHLSNYSPDFPAAGMGQFSASIQNTQYQPIHWKQFTTPPVYKRQFSIRVKKVLGKIEVHPEQDITGSSTGDTVDPCGDLVAHWPIPANQIFDVYGADDEYHAWRAEPVVEFVTKGNSLWIRVYYTGVPAFASAQTSDGVIDKAQFFESSMKLQIASIARGNTP